MQRSHPYVATRNDPYAFALRTRKNLTYVLDAYRHGADVHPINQVTCSLMGIVVFPWEHNLQLEKSRLPIAKAFQNPPLEYQVLFGEVETLGRLWGPFGTQSRTDGSNSARTRATCKRLSSLLAMA